MRETISYFIKGIKNLLSFKKVKIYIKQKSKILYTPGSGIGPRRKTKLYGRRLLYLISKFLPSIKTYHDRPQVLSTQFAVLFLKWRMSK